MKNNNLGKLARISRGFEVVCIHLLIFCYFLYNCLGGGGKIYLTKNELRKILVNNMKIYKFFKYNYKKLKKFRIIKNMFDNL